MAANGPQGKTGPIFSGWRPTLAAVADWDDWDDEKHDAGQYISTLTSPI